MFKQHLEYKDDQLTGSHPALAVKPLVPQPGFEPDVISLKPLMPVE